MPYRGPATRSCMRPKPRCSCTTWRWRVTPRCVVCSACILSVRAKSSESGRAVLPQVRMIGWQPTTTYTRASPATKPDTSAGRRGSSSNASSAICWTTDLRTRISIRNGSGLRQSPSAARIRQRRADALRRHNNHHCEPRFATSGDAESRTRGASAKPPGSSSTVEYEQDPSPANGRPGSQREPSHLHHITAFLRPDSGRVNRWDRIRERTAQPRRHGLESGS